MADANDPLGILQAEAKELKLINELYLSIRANAGNVAAAVRSMSEEHKKVAQSLGLINERNETLVAAEKELDKMYQRRAENLASTKNEINELLSINKKLRDQELQTEREKLAAIEDNLKIARQRQKLLQDTYATRSNLLDLAREERDAELQRIQTLERDGKLEGEALRVRRKAANDRYNAQSAAVAGLRSQLEAQQDIVDATETLLNNQTDQVVKVERTNKGFDTSVSFLDGMIEKTGFFSEKWTTGPLGGIYDFIQAQGDMNELFNDLFTKLKKINLVNLSANVLNAIREGTIKFLIEFDKLAADFRKNTGIIDRSFDGIEQRIVNVQRANLRMGVSMNEAFQAANALTAEMASFTSMTDNAQATVLQAATVLQEFGVGAQTTAQIFNNFSKGLGYNADQLERLSTQLMGISTSLKVPPQIIATEFNAASKELMKYGDDMVGVFEGIAEQSKQTGIAMGELLGIVKQFDTFEGAGAAVGKLNAILGGPYLNAINMLYATEDERIKQLRQSIQLSGRQFNQLSRFEQQAIATAAGISDMTVAARLFGGTNSEFAKTQMSMKEMQQRASDAQSVTDKLTQVTQTFVIALGPLVHVLGLVAEALLFLLNPFGELARMFGADSELVAGLGQFQILLYGVAAAMKLTGVVTGGLGAALSKAFLPVTVAVGTFIALKELLEVLPGPMRIVAGGLIALAGAFFAVATAKSLIGGVAGASAHFLLAGYAAASIAGFGAVISGFDEFGGGKDKGVSARGGMGVLAEPGSGPELLMKGNGGAYLVSTPSLVELNPQDTVYSNAETKAMLSGGGGSRDNSAELAVIRQQQQDAAQDRALIQQTLDAVMTVASRPIELDGKKVFEGTKPQLNRALGLSRRGAVT